MPSSFSPLYTIYSEEELPHSTCNLLPLTVSTSGPLLLAIAGSSLLPLPCAFGQAGFVLGTFLMLLIAWVNDYTTVIMVRAAARLRVSSYEETVLGCAGRQALLVARASLVVLLFGTLCGDLAAISETAARALHLAGHEELAEQRTLILCVATLLVFPLSLQSLGEMKGLSAFGISMMMLMTAYLVYVCAASGATPRAFEFRAQPGALPEAASTFGYAFYVQPCVLPLLRTLPAGEVGALVLERATHLTYIVITVVYLIVGVAGLLFFGSRTPQDVLQGFGGQIGALISGLFCLYLSASFAPIAVPLRESLVRLYQGSTRAGGAAVASPMLLTELSHRVELPPLANALVTAAIIGAVLAVALLLPDASAALFALTGATGVCMVAYVLPAWTHLASPRRARSRAARGGKEGATIALVVAIGLVVSALTLMTIVRRWASATPQTCVGVR